MPLLQETAYRINLTTASLIPCVATLSPSSDPPLASSERRDHGSTLIQFLLRRVTPSWYAYPDIFLVLMVIYSKGVAG